MMRREWQRSGGQPRYIPTSHSLKTEYVLTATNDQLLVTCLRGELPLNAEAVRKFGPMHIPIAIYLVIYLVQPHWQVSNQ